MNRATKIILIVVIISITGCYYDTEERLYPTLSSPCDDTTVTFSKTVNTILQPCLSCHSNSAVNGGDGGGVRLETYDQVKSNKRLMGAVRQENGYIKMPQTGGKLPDCEIAQLQKWMDNPTNN